jgi:diketogulonate reductase-like aldo/keto reductase
MIFDEKVKLNNGTEIPKLALGTWFIDDDKAAEAVREAVKIGYRHIDTAQAYGMNEVSEKVSARRLFPESRSL